MSASHNRESIDPARIEGPRVPVDTVRPVVSEQRVLLLDGAQPEMLDLAAGEVRPWENGPPITVPCESAPFQIADFALLQIQLVRDLRSASTDLTLLSLVVGDQTIEVSDRSDGQLVVAGPDQSAERPIGTSPAIVITIEPLLAEGDFVATVSARNAENAESCSLTVPLPNELATITIGGPSTTATGRFGRRRPSAVHIVARRHETPTHIARRVVGRARREASSLLDRGK